MLEGTLPNDRRQTRIDAHETTIEPDDAPEWIANQQAVDAATDVADEAAIAISGTQPTTLAGVVVVLEYAAAYVRRDRCEWPSNLIADDENDWRKGCRWEVWFHEMLAEAVQAIATSSPATA